MTFLQSLEEFRPIWEASLMRIRVRCGCWLRLTARQPGRVRGEEIVRRGKRRFMWPTKRVVDWFIAEAKDFEADAILFGAPHPLTRAGARLKDELGIPVGILCHGAEVTIPAAIPGLRTWLRRTLRTADVLFAVSRFTQGKVSRLTGRDVVPIGAGVDVEMSSPPPTHRQRTMSPWLAVSAALFPAKVKIE